VWKRICADILAIAGIALAFLGVLYAYSWHRDQQAAEQGRKLLADLTGRYEALDSFGDIDLDPSNLTLAKLEERFRQPPALYMEQRTEPQSVGHARAGNVRSGSLS